MGNVMSILRLQSNLGKFPSSFFHSWTWRFPGIFGLSCAMTNLQCSSNCPHSLATPHSLLALGTLGPMNPQEDSWPWIYRTVSGDEEQWKLSESQSYLGINYKTVTQPYVEAVCKSHKRILLNPTLHSTSLKLDHKNAGDPTREVWQTWS